MAKKQIKSGIVHLLLPSMDEIPPLAVTSKKVYDIYYEK